MQIPFFKEISDSNNILLAGAGGGFDIVSGIPLYLYLVSEGKNVILANLSFTELFSSGDEEVCPWTYSVTAEAAPLPYFPEKYILQWLEEIGHKPFMYGFSNNMGVKPLLDGYNYVIEKHNIDTIVLVDGGTDGLMRGDEPKVGTIVEDACSIITCSMTDVKKRYIVTTAFGAEHTLDHYTCLENIADLTKEGAFKGAVSITDDMPEGRYYLELVERLNKDMAKYPSIITNSIASAMKGEFGDYHPTARTKGSIQFINPFMTLWWFFALDDVAEKIGFAEKAKDSETMDDVAKAYLNYRACAQRRPVNKIPLT